MTYQRQLTLFPNQQRLFYGGELIQGRRKTARPLCHKRPLHLVLKVKKQVLFSRRKELLRLFHRYGQRFSIKIYGLTVQKDHLHALVKIGGRKSYLGFIRSLCGQMARLLGKDIFKVLPFTRVVAWGRGFRQVKVYLTQNENEVLGLQEYSPRNDHYRKYRKSPQGP